MAALAIATASSSPSSQHALLTPPYYRLLPLATISPPQARLKAVLAAMDPSQVKIPPMKDLTADNITENTIIINSQGPDRRLQYLLERLVTHLHDFARETRLTTEEWMAGIMFLTAVGQICSDTRQVPLLPRTPRLLNWRHPANRTTSGIHSPLGRPRPIHARREHQSPQAGKRNGGHRSRPVPHGRRARVRTRGQHLQRRQR